MVRENYEEARKVVLDLDTISDVLYGLEQGRHMSFDGYGNEFKSDVFREDLIDFLAEEQKKLKSIFSRL